MIYPLNMNWFLLIPLTFLLVMSTLGVMQAIRGRFHPPSTFLRGLGGAIYIFGFGLCSLEGMTISQLSGGLMLWGLAIKLVPRFLAVYDEMTPDGKI